MDPAPQLSKWALITGVSHGGLGDALTSELLRRGINVIATALQLSMLDYLQPPTSNLSRLQKLELDVTSSSSILTAVSATAEIVQGRGLDFLFNNAGYGYMGPLIDCDVDGIRRNFEVNVFGLLAVTQAFFPLLREARGMVVNMGSITGLSGIYQPFIGSYSASKSAVAKLGDTLRVELAPFGIKVVTLVTGAVRTPFWDNLQEGSRSSGSAADLTPDSPYHLIHDRVFAMMAGKSTPPGQWSPERWARHVLNDLLRSRTPSHVRRGGTAILTWFLSWLLPYWLFDWLYARMAHLDRLKTSLLQHEVQDKKSR